MTLAEMYVQGVSTRKVTAIVEQLCGASVSSSVVSQAAALLDESLEAWRNRSLGEFVYLFLDARYEKVRQDGEVRDAALLIAMGVDHKGRRHILGISISLGEHEIHWRNFLQSLVKRGLKGVQFIISDDYQGLKAARLAVFGGIPWQRCQFHLQRNASQHVSRQSMKTEVAADSRRIYNAPNHSTADIYLAQVVQRYAKIASKLADWIEKNVPEGLTVFAFPLSHQHKLRTTNGLERLSREICRRTRVATISPNEASCLRLISAVLMEFDEEWQTGKIYLNFEIDDPFS
jgi:transposase-like protein